MDNSNYPYNRKTNLMIPEWTVYKGDSWNNGLETGRNLPFLLTVGLQQYLHWFGSLFKFDLAAVHNEYLLWCVQRQLRKTKPGFADRYSGRYGNWIDLQIAVIQISVKINIKCNGVDLKMQDINRSKKVEMKVD